MEVTPAMAGAEILYCLFQLRGRKLPFFASRAKDMAVMVSTHCPQTAGVDSMSASCCLVVSIGKRELPVCSHAVREW